MKVQFFFFLNTNFKHLAIFCDCTARFVSDLVGNPEDRFSHNEAQIIYRHYLFTFALMKVQFFFFLNTNFKHLAIFCDCTARFVSDLVGNPEDRFSHNEAQIIYRHYLFMDKSLKHLTRIYDKLKFLLQAVFTFPSIVLSFDTRQGDGCRISQYLS